jgi:hypothetical protein
MDEQYDVDVNRFLRMKNGIRIIPFRDLDQFVANRRRNHGDFDDRPAFRRRPVNSQEPRLDLNLVEGRI